MYLYHLGAAEPTQNNTDPGSFYHIILIKLEHELFPFTLMNLTSFNPALTSEYWFHFRGIWFQRNLSVLLKKPWNTWKLAPQLQQTLESSNLDVLHQNVKWLLSSCKSATGNVTHIVRRLSGFQTGPAGASWFLTPDQDHDASYRESNTQVMQDEHQVLWWVK